MTEYEKAIAFNREIKTVIETLINALNKGQRQKLMRNENVQAVLKLYGVEIEEE